MSILADFVDKLTGLARNEIHEINGEFYSDKGLTYIKPVVDRPKMLTVNSLDGIVQMVHNELDVIASQPVFIRVVSPEKVEVFTTYDGFMERDYLYQGLYDGKGFEEGFREHAAAIIELQSRFVQTDDVKYLMDLLSRVCVEQDATTKDNGVSQQIMVRKGVTLKEYTTPRQRVSLRPYRTFLEVEQPESEFLLRMGDNGEVGLFEADGGAWKITAKIAIRDYFRGQLAEEIEAGRLVILI